MDGSIVFICRDNEEIGMFYVNVFIVEFTAVKFEIKIIIIIICSDHDCGEFEPAMAKHYGLFCEEVSILKKRNEQCVLMWIKIFKVREYMLFQNKIRCGVFDQKFSFLVRGSDIDEEFYPIVLAEETPEKVRFTFIVMGIFFQYAY